MNVMAHAGYTLALIFVVDQALRHVRQRRALKRGAPSASTIAGVAVPQTQGGLWPIDYRMVVAGSLLPDLIDKPLGFWLAPDLVNHSLRSVGHSWLLPALLLLGALLASKTARRWLLWLGVSSAIHLLLDQMWGMPTVIAWPFLGWSFPRGTTTLAEWFLFHTRGGALEVTELPGGLILVVATLRLLYQRRLRRSIRHAVT